MNHSRYDHHMGLPRVAIKRGLVFGCLIITALLAFEIFNFSTTEYSLRDLLGGLNYAGIRWSTILATAFCLIDFAGLARLFTPEQGSDEPVEVWYLFGAWLLAATMNAILTWWGISVAMLNQAPPANNVVDRALVVRAVPIFVAVMVWLIRILIIGTFSAAGDRLFSQAPRRASTSQGSARTQPQIQRPLPSVQGAMHNIARPSTHTVQPVSSQVALRAAPKPHAVMQNGSLRAEPTYHPISMSAAGRRSDGYPQQKP